MLLYVDTGTESSTRCLGEKMGSKGPVPEGKTNFKVMILEALFTAKPHAGLRQVTVRSRIDM